MLDSSSQDGPVWKLQRRRRWFGWAGQGSIYFSTIPVWSVSWYRRRRAVPGCRKKFSSASRKRKLQDIEGEYRREGFEADAFKEESADSKARVKQFGGFRFQHIEAGSVEPKNEQQQQYGGHDGGGKAGSFYQSNARGGAYHRKPYDLDDDVYFSK